MLQSPNGERFLVTQGVAQDIGFDEQAQLRLPGDPASAAARIATIIGDGREAWLEVRAREPLTCVNGRPIRRMARLLAGDRVCFGSLCLDLLGSAPAVDADVDAVPVAAYALRKRSGIGSGCMRSGATLHLDRNGEPVSPAAGVVGIVLVDEAVYLDPGSAEVRVNGHPVTREVRIRDGDNIQVGHQRYMLEARGFQSVMPMPAAPDETSPAEPVPVKRNQNSLWWLVVAAAGMAAMLSALLYFRGGA